jgi:outer membrane lipoprotein-sorting protein
MKATTLLAAAGILLLGFSGTAAADDKADQAIQELEQQFAKVKSYTAKSEALTDTEFSPGHAQKSEMKGTIEWMRKGEKALMRSDTKCETTKTEGGQTTRAPSTITTVVDGEFYYMLTEEGDQKTVVKSLAPAAQTYHPQSTFDAFRSHFDIKLLPDEKVGGHDCYVFEMKMKPMEGMPPSGRQLMYYEKKHGLNVKSAAYDANEKLISSSLTTDLKVNVDISAERFTFEVPPGAQVIDSTAAAQQPPPEEAQSEQPEEPKEEKKEEKKKKIKLPKFP